MSKMIAYCGLVCSNCPTFLATRDDDDAAREKTVALYKEKFGLHLQKEDINCDGCQSVGGRLIGYCHTCEIRRCGRERGVTNCAWCEEQPCEKLSRFQEFSPEAKAAFEALKKELLRD